MIKKPEPKAILRKDKRTVAAARERVQFDETLSAESKTLILGFLSVLATEELSGSTIIRYAEALRVIGGFLPPGGFRYLRRPDIQSIIMRLSERNYASATMSGLKQRLLRFQRWLREEQGYPEDYPDPGWAGRRLDPGDKPIELRGIKIGCKYKLRYGPEDLPTEGDVNRMIDVAYGCRDRALVAVLYESGARLSEFMNLQIRCVEHTPYGWKIHVDGKTGRRPIMLVNSGPYLASWLNLHPFKDDPEAPVWISTGTRRNARTHFEKTGEMMSMDRGSVRAVLETLGARAGIRKKLNPHAFRHARATELAKHLTESQLRSFMGWSPGSPMPGIYVHLSGRDTEKAILEAHGIPLAGESKLSSPRQCPACAESNPNDARFCLRCKQPLDTVAGQALNEAFTRFGPALPEILKNDRALRDFRRLLNKHKIPCESAPKAI